MRQTLSALALALCCALAPCAMAAIKGNAASEALIVEGNELYSHGKLSEALAKYRAAAKADPGASTPVSYIANVFLFAAGRTDPEHAREYRDDARAAALAALKIDGADPMAQEILRHLDDGPLSPLHVPNQEATRLYNDGEDLFARRDYDAALLKYEAAARADPAYSSPWVMAGDCYFVRQDWKAAEARFRKATEIEALNSQAWRFLSDALAEQQKFEAAEAALYSAIAAHPGQMPNWGKLASLQHPILPVTALGLKRKGSVSTDAATGKVTITLDPSLSDEKGKGTLDHSFWLSFALAGIIGPELDKALKRPATPFEHELEAWTKSLNIAAGIRAKDDKLDWDDPALRHLARIAREGQLEAAVLLLLYKESYRPALEDWKRRNPSGVRDFIARYGLRP